MSKNFAVFCGASTPTKQEIVDEVRHLIHNLAKINSTFIYGGASIGLMGLIADTALEEKASVIGVIPESICELEIAHNGLTELIKVSSMHERKQLMYERSDEFIILPGGFGSMDEFFEILTWKQLQYHQKPIHLLNISGYYTKLLELFDSMIETGLLSKNHLSLFTVHTSAQNFIQFTLGEKNES